MQLILQKNKYINILAKLEALSPISTIKRGYAVTRLGDKVITSVKDIKKDDKLNIELADGSCDVKVI